MKTKMEASKPRVIKLRKFRLLLDRAVIYEWGKQVDGRFWGIASVAGLLNGLIICFLISPNEFTLSSALSDFGNNVRTAPYFSGSLFFASYGLWRWRKYVSRGHRNRNGMGILFTQMIFSLVLVALMPYSWHPWAYRIHIVAVAVLGYTIALTVVMDILLTKPEKAVHAGWRIIRGVAFLVIVAGCCIISASSAQVGWLHVTLLGEMALLQGFGLWIVMKTFANVDEPSKLASLVRSIILVE